MKKKVQQFYFIFNKARSVRSQCFYTTIFTVKIYYLKKGKGLYAHRPLLFHTENV